MNNEPTPEMLSCQLGVVVLQTATATLGLSGPQPWAGEMGIDGDAHGMAWCGIWARCMWSRSKLSVPKWVIGSGNTHYLKRTTTPILGDLVCWRGKTGHQSIYCSRHDNMVRTIDGNSSDGVSTGIVCFRTRPAIEVLAYFSKPEVTTC